MDIVENAKTLLSKIAQDPVMDDSDKLFTHEFVLNCMQDFSKYVEATNRYVFTVHSISELRQNGCISQEEFERRLMTVDTERRGKHNRAIDSCNQLNRLCDRYKIQQICKVDSGNRYAVADFAAQFAMATHGYALNHNYTMDEVVSMMEKDTNLLKHDVLQEEH